MKDIGVDIMKAALTNDPIEAFRSIFGNLGQGQPLYFYLLDEVTGFPVEGDKFPIEIDVASKEYMQFMATNIHLIQSGYQLVKIANSVAGIFSAMGVPHVSSSSMVQIERLLELPPNSVQNYKAVESALNGEAVTSVRGPALRELENFFRDKEINDSFAELSRKYHKMGRRCGLVRKSLDYGSLEFRRIISLRIILGIESL
ncbi:Aste57867_23989 [Aphanomyces stellatus]|uniref:Aste57867_23989 protein n=1 Tax=Aphanomyces stellatus TaxID=120398 RepID=A0A485LP92_9STRA|nr:hypothetical protein As57867_023916 [Aphanomyces stellatus]VFU00632.1 Aste57867_23989 [Aphanomyces stellatus]